jgi:hypothetical protein
VRRIRKGVGPHDGGVERPGMAGPPNPSRKIHGFDPVPWRLGSSTHDRVSRSRVSRRKWSTAPGVESVRSKQVPAICMRSSTMRTSEEQRLRFVWRSLRFCGSPIFADRRRARRLLRASTPVPPRRGRRPNLRHRGPRCISEGPTKWQPVVAPLRRPTAAAGFLQRIVSYRGDGDAAEPTRPRWAWTGERAAGRQRATRPNSAARRASDDRKPATIPSGPSLLATPR